MTRVLGEVVAQIAIFLETAAESVVPLEQAVKLQEEMAFSLQKLSMTERAEFIEILGEIAEEEVFQAHRETLRRLPSEVGI